VSTAWRCARKAAFLAETAWREVRERAWREEEEEYMVST
jgi:hypothetical protein